MKLSGTIDCVHYRLHQVDTMIQSTTVKCVAVSNKKIHNTICFMYEITHKRN